MFMMVINVNVYQVTIFGEIFLVECEVFAVSLLFTFAEGWPL